MVQAAAKPVRYCFIMRHGERADKSNDEELKAQYTDHADPILTPTGWRQARETGAFMRGELDRIQQLEGRNFDEVRLYASPFERTISTSVEVAKGIGCNHIQLDYNWSEGMYTRYYSENPFPKLESSNIGMSGLSNKH